LHRLVTQSTAWAQRQQHAITARLVRAEAELARLRVKKGERADALRERIDALLKRHDVAAWLQVSVSETSSVQQRSGRKGRPSAAEPSVEVTSYDVQWTSQRDERALKEAHTLAGWRIYVTNSPATELSVVDAMGLYREEWTVEHGFHRWKGGHLPALALFLHIEWRIRGLMLLLLIGLQVLGLLEWQARRTLAAKQATLVGLVPGNPKMATAYPTAERLLAMFTSLHLLLQQADNQRIGQVLESLTPLQQRIVHLLQLPATLYRFQARLSVPDAAAEG
jgi:transposase